MITIAIANQKGGVGKTTTAVNLAAALARQKYRVLLADMDAQAGATQNCIDNFGPVGRVIRDILVDLKPARDAIITTAGGFDLLPSDLTLAGLDKELGLKANADGRLKIALSSLEDDYDFTIIDCPGWLGMATLNGFVAADYVLIPIDCKPQGIETVNRLLGEIRDVAAAYRRPIGTIALPTFYEARTRLSNDILEMIREKFESATLSPINKNIKLAEAYLHRQTIFDYDQTATGAMDYFRVAKEVAHVTDQERPRQGRGTRTAEE